MLTPLCMCAERMTELTAEINAGRTAWSEVESLHKEAKQCLDKLESANRTFKGELCNSPTTDIAVHTAELSVPLEYGDHKKMALFQRTFGLEFKVTEGMS